MNTSLSKGSIKVKKTSIQYLAPHPFDIMTNFWKFSFHFWTKDWIILFVC